MKKALFSSAILLAVTVFAARTVQAQAVEQGNFMTTVQYGFPDLFKTVVKRALDNSNNNNLVIKGVGPITNRNEFMVTDKIGLGLVINYTNMSIGYTSQDTNYTTSPPTVTNYEYTLKLNRFRIMPRFGFHFGNSDKFDGYFGVAAGYYNVSLKYETNDPNANDDDYKFTNLVPFSMRVDVGGTYYVTDKIGFNLEIGFGGGPIINFGTSAKF